MKPFFALAVASIAIASQAALAETSLRFSHSYTENDARHEWAQFIAERVDEKTNGEVIIDIYPNQQISKAQAQHQGLRQGRLDIAIYPMPWLSGMAPLAEIGALPGLVTDPTEGLDWRDMQIWPMLEEAVAGTGVVLGGSGWAMATIGNTGSPIMRPSDLEDHRMRGLGRASEKMLNSGGATITSLPASELYQALQTGVLTGVLTQYASFEGYNMHEVIDHLQVGRGYIGGMHGILLNARLEDKVGADHYQATLDAIEESEAWFAEKMIEDSARIAEDFKRKGVTLYELTEEDLQVWMEHAQDTAWPYFIESVPNGAAALEAINQPL